MPSPVRRFLTERDQRVLLSLFKHEFLTLPQIQRLHFPSGQTAARRVRRLRELQFITTLEIEGIGEQIETLAARGARAVAAYLGTEWTELGWRPMQAKEFADQSLRSGITLNDFRINLTLACARSGVTLGGFIPGRPLGGGAPAGQRRWIQDVVADILDPSDTLTHSPDAVFLLQTPSGPGLFFLQIERPSVGDSRGESLFSRWADFYEGSLKGNAYQKYRDVFRLTKPLAGFRVLVLVRGPRRIEQLREFARTHAPDRRIYRFLWVKTLTQAMAPSVLEQPWVPIRAVRGDVPTLAELQV